MKGVFMENNSSTPSKVEQFTSITTEMAQLYKQKNENYGDSFSKLYETLGPISGLVPLHNKLDRITNLIKNAKETTNHFESIEDTLRDLACYAIMYLIELKGDNNINHD